MARRVSARRALSGAVALLGAALFALVSGCDPITGGCGKELEAEPPVSYADGTAEGGIYRSTSWDPDDWIDFPPGISVRFEHKLGAEPRAWQAYVATSREGDGSNLVLAAGSEVELVDIDELAVTVRNATCVDFFVVMVAMSSVE